MKYEHIDIRQSSTHHQQAMCSQVIYEQQQLL